MGLIDWWMTRELNEKTQRWLEWRRQEEMDELRRREVEALEAIARGNVTPPSRTNLD